MWSGLLRITLMVLTVVVSWLTVPRAARAAEPPVSVPTELPRVLTLDETLRIFRSRGLDLLIAEATVKSAEGGVQAAGAVANPVVSTSVGNAITYNNSAFSQADCLRNGSKCSPWIYNVGITDSAALVDALSGKRDLRLKVARNALAAAKMTRLDAERVIAFQVKATYLQVVQAVLALEFARQVSVSNATTLKKFQDRYRSGAINEGDLERIETQKLESDQVVDTAVATAREARVALAFLLGVRGEVPDFDVDTKVLGFAVPASLRDATEIGLLRTAFDHRPDLISFGYLRASAEAQLQLTKRQKFPDITLGANYAWGGFGGVSTNGPVGPQVVTLSVSAPLPAFYQFDGQQRQAEAQRDAASLQQAKTTSQVVSDVATGFADFVAARKRVERMEGPRRDGGGLLESAKGAFNVTALQYEKGAASLTDYLDALRTYIAVQVEYFGNLTSYWTSVFQIEAAVSTELRQ
jgi:cobalt-zinc-cadmium efflux system outer membrane protein